jgi:hypothetical protein
MLDTGMEEAEGGAREAPLAPHLPPHKLRDPVLGGPVHGMGLVALRDEQVLDSAEPVSSGTHNTTNKDQE